MDKNDSSLLNREKWNEDHSLLRRQLEDEKNLPAAVETFMDHHAAVHSSELAPGGWSFQDEVLEGLTEAEFRCIPPGGEHSAIWMLWHITRIEDATINVLLADAPQVFFSGDWQKKTASPLVDTVNEAPMEDIVRLSQAVDVQALLAYRLEVARRTHQVIRDLKPEGLWEKPAPRRLQRLLEDGTVRQEAAGLLDYWGGHPAFNLWLMPATRHHLVHLNELLRLRPKLKKFAR